MDVDSIGRAGDTVVGAIAPAPVPEEPVKEAESPPPEPERDSGKILDLYA